MAKGPLSKSQSKEVQINWGAWFKKQKDKIRSPGEKSPKDGSAKDKDKGAKGKECPLKESSSSADSTWSGFKTTTNEIDKWTEYTRDQPQFIASKR